ncbi:MAG TPA: M6 family metalloprotease domain-containing protein [Thermoanaerobaculia bacterium]|nr:M6 family metalloprotease domain-containing protein [Thermoanaerobaculia bacterium]HUM30978.1 M6 family metalloprotease domain-containing protein [Thermoanaerobaculia bacterium]HXK69289.1 M6 family metalloprotease domain-containing protein [Thermoanaerobaculia bacterium]
MIEQSSRNALLSASKQGWITVIWLCALMVLLSTGTGWAVKANPFPYTLTQPDGTTIGLRMIGDERIVFYETEAGRTILRRDDGWWVYADPNSNGQAALEPTPLRVGVDAVPADWPLHIRPHLDPSSLRIPFQMPHDGSIRSLFLSQGYGTSRESAASRGTNAVNPTSLTLPVLVILVEFSDWKHTTGPGTPLPTEPDYQPVSGQPNSAASWQILFGDPSVPGGLNHYFNEVSYGQFQWQVEVAQNGLGSGTVVNDGWYVNPETMAYWGTDKKQGSYCNSDSANTKIYNLPQWAITAADPDVDYSKYDTNGDGTITDAELMIFVIHARPGQENYGDDCWGGDPQHHIWSHQWILFANVDTDDGVTFSSTHGYSLNPEFEPGLDRSVTPYEVLDKWYGVGVYAHEGFHTLGGPDLYDYDYDANVAGEWDLMDNGSYNGAKSGMQPSHMGTPLKFDIELNNSTSSFGWIFDADIQDLYTASTHHEGMYQIDALGGSSRSNVMHRIITPNDSGEWFVLENRAPSGYYEPFLPEYGLLVWHRDVSGSRDDWPYKAAVERRGWADTLAGLNSGTAGAAFSLDDGEVELTTTTDPSNALNNDNASGLLNIRCIGAETATIGYIYGSISGPNPDFAGSTLADPEGDNDLFLDNGETAVMTVNISNSSCAGEAASGTVFALGVSPQSDIPASAVVITPSAYTLGTIEAGQTVQREFTITLLCDPAGYAGQILTFAYTVTGSNFSAVTGSFSRETDKDYLIIEDMESPVGWTGTFIGEVSACSSAAGHGDWTWSTERYHSPSHSFHSPEETENVCYADPEESLVSPNIIIPAGISLKELTFWHAADIPCPQSSRARVWISVDNGGTWTRVDSFYKDGGDLSWEQTRLNLTALAGVTQFRFKFVMYTYECWSGCEGTEGWYIDDISIIVDEMQPPLCGTTAVPVPSGVESGTSPLRVTKADGAGDPNDLTITWDTSHCVSARYHLLWGRGSNLATYTLLGASPSCDITSPYTWEDTDSVEALLWFLVAGDDDAGLEGGWGTDSWGAPRSVTPSGFCATTGISTAACSP